MPDPLSGLVLGALLGMRHALEPDHLTAISVLITERPGDRRGAVLGAWWGMGHTAALLSVGLVLALLRTQMPARLLEIFELAVAVMLMALGVRAVRRALGDVTAGPVLTHHHRSMQHQHPAAADHVHVGSWTLAKRPLAMGIIHGLAGSGALTALVVAEMPTMAARLLFIGLFGAGSVAGMAVLSGLVGWPLARIGRRPVVSRVVTGLTGLLSTGIGVAWAWPLVARVLA